MNKAFIKEDDIDNEVRWEEPLGNEPRLVTPEGYEAYRLELEQLEQQNREFLEQQARELEDSITSAGGLPAAADGTERPQSTPHERRLRFLRRLLPLLSVVSPSPGEPRAYFGAWVTVEDEDEQTRIYRLVGKDEVDASTNFVNVDAPIGRALLGKKAGDVGVIVRPDGDYENLEILAVSWEAPR